MTYLLLFLTLISPAIADLPLPGHLEPIGSHTSPLFVETHFFVPPPHEFFARYVSASRPVVFKGAAKDFPAYQRWTDEYLRKYGNWKVIVEDGKKEDRERPTYTISLHDFLNGYKNNDTYLVQDVVPPNPMTEEILLPKCIQCGGFQDNIQSAVMWFSSGGTKSTLHADSVDNLECMLDGWKEYLLINKKEAEGIELDNVEKYQGLDVDRVDMVKFPEISLIKWYKMHVEPGDCYFVPSGWFHFVNSSNTRNLAVSFWMNHLHRVVNDCHLKEKRKMRLSEIQVCDETESYRGEVLELFLGAPNMSLEVFRTFFANDPGVDDTDDPTQQPRNKKTRDWLREHMTGTVEKIFRKMDSNGDELLSVDEVYEAPSDLLETLVGSVGQEFSKYETMGTSSVEIGVAILKDRKRMFLRNEL